MFYSLQNFTEFYRNFTEFYWRPELPVNYSKNLWQFLRVSVLIFKLYSISFNLIKFFTYFYLLTFSIYIFLSKKKKVLKNPGMNNNNNKETGQIHACPRCLGYWLVSPCCRNIILLNNILTLQRGLQFTTSWTSSALQIWATALAMTARAEADANARGETKHVNENALAVVQLLLHLHIFLLTL